MSFTIHPTIKTTKQDTSNNFANFGKGTGVSYHTGHRIEKKRATYAKREGQVKSNHGL